jgi:signal transduction histidine kinase/HAMP domain-containing protein
MKKSIEAIEGQIQEAFILHAANKSLYDKLQTISTFAYQKGDTLFDEGSQTMQDFKTQLILLILIVLLSSWLLILFLMRSVKDPLSQMLPFLAQAKSTHFQSRLPDLGKNEFGSLALAINHLTETIDIDLQKQTLLEQLTDTLISTDELSIFSKKLLQVLIEQSHAKAGAIYVLDENKESFALQASVGLSLENYKEFDASSHHGIFGLSLMSGKMEEIVPGSEHALVNMRYLEFDLLPKKILTIPIMTGQQVIALISLSSLDGFDDLILQTICDASELISARMISILAFNRIRLFTQKLENQNQEIEEQKNELSRQSQELQEQNRSLEIQKNQLQELNKLKTSFLSNMSHELRTPLNSIIALSSVLGKRWESKMPMEEIEYLGVIEKSGKHLLDLINDILNLSKLEAGKESVSISSLNLKDLVNEVFTSIKPQADQKNLIFKQEILEDLLISSDISKLRHILQNLIGNAVKFTEKGFVTVRAQQTNQTLCIQVEDSGIGIASKHLPYIFDEFRQADEKFSKKYEGTGLGLAIAKKYATLLQGNIRVESTLGKGSTFTLCLPLLWNKSSSSTIPVKSFEENESYSPTEKGKKKILLIEDSKPALIQLKEILKHEGYQVITAENGVQGLKRIKEDDPDGIILDLMMPEMDGFEVLKIIRSDPQTKLLPVLILSAKHISKEELSFLKGNNIHQLIQKGDISKYDLLNAIQSMVFSSKTKTSDES